MLEQIDALPRTKSKLTTVNGDREIDARKNRADVGGHVVWPFEGVAELAGIFGDQALEVVLDVGDNVRVVVLLDGERGGGMTAEKGEQSGGIGLFGDPGGDARGDVVKALAAGGDGELADVLQGIRIH